jgi:hypothetical protein
MAVAEEQLANFNAGVFVLSGIAAPLGEVFEGLREELLSAELLVRNEGQEGSLGGHRRVRKMARK